MALLYSKINKDFKTGDLVIWDSESYSNFFEFVLFLYQKILGARYTHVGVVMVSGGRTYVVEATPPRVRIFPLRECEDFYIIPINMSQDPEKLENFLTEKVGFKYSLLDLAKSVLGIANSKKDYYCSELACDFYCHFGYIADRKAGFVPDTLINAVARVANKEPEKVIIDLGNL